MKKQEMNNLVAGVKIQSKKDLAVYTIVGIDLKQGKFILDNGKLYAASTMQRWFDLYEEEIPEVVEPDNTVLDDIEQADEFTQQEQDTATTADTEEQQDTDTTANTSDLQEDTSDLKDTDTQVNEVHEDTEQTTKTHTTEGNTATTEELELDEDLEVILAQLGCTATKRKEYLGIYKQRYRGCVAMLRNSKEGNLHIDIKEKIYKALDEEVREQIEADYNTGIYDKTRGYFRIKDCDNLRVLAVVLKTALQLAELIG